MADALFAQSRLRREAEVGAQLPYARHLNDAVVALDSGALMMMFQVSGASFETADAGDFNNGAEGPSFWIDLWFSVLGAFWIWPA